jgi:hypothetical protein
MNISFNPTNFSIKAILNDHKFYAELTDFPRDFASLILDEVRLYSASDYALWVSQDRKRINSQDEAGGETFEPQIGNYEVIGNHSYVLWELGNWAVQATTAQQIA